MAAVSLFRPYPMRFSSSPLAGSGGCRGAGSAFTERRITRPAGAGAGDALDAAAALRFMPLVGGGKSRKLGSMTGSWDEDMDGCVVVAAGGQEFEELSAGKPGVGPTSGC